ncbi:protein translocase subunit SecD [Actinomadura livida]|uniref:Multifunctional fusion protein n=1 Tax=Actinomadura livida TaxID=79909 RepID=A0A7W7MZ62_9ACTN|nr:MULTISPECIES: protein translocase subunit SecD [Actinomadura]MBB4776646.1 SecD/SecF fusion protein [Actinomadura catellatispora]GGT93793.1 protein translocase subunit SecDF [Actinomadura livida]
MNRANLVRAVLALAVLATSFYFAYTKEARLGLDLRGGTQIVLETQDSPTVKADRESTDRALEVMRRRIDALGVAESSITRSGDRRLIVELPDVQDPTRATEAIGKTAQLTAHPVLPNTGQQPAKAKGQQVLPDESGQPILIGPAALSGEGIGEANASFDPQNVGGWAVNVDFKGSGGKTWEQLTAKAACAAGDERRIAIVLDGKVISSPQVTQSVPCGVGITGGSTQITGDFGADEAKDLAALIEGGALPVPVKIIEQRVVGPTLGDEAIDASAKAAVIGIILTGLFIVAVYRLVGFLATVALAGYALISYGALVAIGATLTLPGLAGFVLAIGMAIDANVLAFERAREELAAAPARRARTVLATGFNKAWSAIADTAVTTLLAGALLFFLASGPVRGFGVTLTIGVIASLISAMLVSRVLTDAAAARFPKLTKGRAGGLSGAGRIRRWLEESGPDLMKRRRIWLTISGVAVAAAALGIFTQGLNYGVEFTGGRIVEYSTSRPLDIDDAREAVSDAGFPRAVVQSSGESDISVRTSDLTNEEVKRIQDALGKEGGGADKIRDELIGPSLGDELRTKALIALGVALLAQLAYLTIRFRWTFATGAVVAMFHDIMIVTGVFAWLGKPIDGVFLAALLTIIGYSVNDSVVVFDRIRELWGDNPKGKFADIANRGTLQTVPRTINTGMGALFILGALAVLGGDSLMDFAIALLIGIVVGTYSSVFTATPVAILLEKYAKSPPPQPKDKPKAPVHRTSDSSGAVV